MCECVAALVMAGGKGNCCLLSCAAATTAATHSVRLTAPDNKDSCDAKTASANGKSNEPVRWESLPLPGAEVPIQWSAMAVKKALWWYGSGNQCTRIYRRNSISTMKFRQSHRAMPHFFRACALHYKGARQKSMQAKKEPPQAKPCAHGNGQPAPRCLANSSW